jgi:hypothetical protein
MEVIPHVCMRAEVAAEVVQKISITTIHMQTKFGNAKPMGATVDRRLSRLAP